MIQLGQIGCWANVVGVSLLLICQSSLRAQEFTDQQIEFFENKVRPLLVEHCYECHGPDVDEAEGGLRLASRKSILAGGDSGSAIDLEKPANSLLLDAVNYGDLFEMPPDSKLPEEAIATIRRWVEMRAPWPAGSDVAIQDAGQFDLLQRRSAHWCWQPASRPSLPDVQDPGWALDPLDKFILKRLEEKQLAPARPTGRATWIRRVYFDLIGLPPTPQAVNSFVNDPSAQAYEKVVDELLASPHFGERWARHWMDLIRYAETCGHEFDYPIPNAYQYRDYLIRAFNADVPYDQFVVEHIAGDLVQQPRRNPDNQINESILGTGFWYLGEATHGPVDVKGNEAGHIDNRIDVMSKTFLGVTIACARCHDHKFDAISTEDYYALSGYLQSSRRQEVLLDPHRKIETSVNQIKKLIGQADHELTEFVENLDKQDLQYYAAYMNAAVVFLQRVTDWRYPSQIRVEAESLKPVKTSSGTVQTQKIKDNQQHQWSGGKQLWWIDGQIGDSIELAVEIPRAGDYQVTADFTMAPEYGMVQVQFNGDKPGEPIDLFSKRVQKSGVRNFGLLALAAGQQTIRLTLLAKDKQAVERRMVGVDYFEFRRQNDAARSEMVLDEIAQDKNLDPQRIRRWANAITDDESKRISHPLYALRGAAESDLDLNDERGQEFFGKLALEVTKQEQAWQDWDNQTVVFSHTEAGKFSRWRRTGWAFSNESAGQNDQWYFFYRSPDQPFWTAATPHSGLFGDRKQGVIRSPEFEITQPFINYRVMGNKVQIRLIVDGYKMDVYNGLLFAGFRFNVDTNGRFEWKTQGGDLKNYLGHRAHIEIIDQGDGSVVVDQVRFSKSANAVERFNETTRAALPIAGQNESSINQGSVAATPLERICLRLAKQITAPHGDQLSSIKRTGGDQQSILNLLFKHRLFHGDAQRELAEKISSLRSRIEQIDADTPPPIRAVGMTDGSAEDEFVFIRGNHRNRGLQVARRPIAATLDARNRWETRYDSGSGRLRWARHIVSPHHPLTSRVIVNRLWHHLTGRGIVASTDNFGLLGQQPTHPDLLDYLASELVDDGWSLKRLMRRIVLSQTYRMSSQVNLRAVEIDPDNLLLHRSRVKRLQAEAIRDSMLSVSGQLDLKMYGPGVAVHLTPFMQGRGRPGKSGPLDGGRRRSLYTEVRRNFLPPMMLAFDMPIPFNSIGRRNISNVPAQSLILMNDPFVVQQADQWAERIISSQSTAEHRVIQMFQSALGREPTRQEQDEAIAFLHRQAAELQVDEKMVLGNQPLWRDLAHVIFNMKEFIFLK